MSIKPLKELLNTATEDKYAVGAFNIVNHLTAKSVIDTCEENNSPVILQMSVKTVKQIGINVTVQTILPLVKNSKVPATLHLDHCTDPDFAKKCIDAGFPSIMIDASKKDLEENIKITSDIKEYGQSNGGVNVEGELGAIVGIEDDIFVKASDSSLADVKSSEIFASRTNVDAFAPAIGTAHGLYKGEPKIDFERFKEIRKVCYCPLVVHGGTGLADSVFKELISLGASKINISTAIKIAYISSIREFMENNPKVSEPLRLDAYIAKKISETVKKYIELFGSINKA